MKCTSVAGVAILLALVAGCSAPEAPAVQPSAIQPGTVRLNMQLSEHGVAWAELGEGEPLLLLNGTASPASEWDPAFLAGLAENARVIVFDYPGLGQSTAAAQRSFRAMAASTSQLLTDIGVGSADVLGWSMGGFIAQELLRSHPDQLRHVVLMATNPGGAKTVLGPPWVQRADSNADAGLRTYLRTNYPPTVCARRAGNRFIDRLASAQNSGRFPPSRVPAATNRTMVAAEDPWLRSAKNLRDLGTVTTPVQVLVGRRDVITPPRNSRILARAIPGARLTIVPGAGHSVAFQAPAAVSRVVTQFLAGTPTPRILRTRCG